MSTEILFDTTGRRLTNKSDIKSKSMKMESTEVITGNTHKIEVESEEVQGSTSGKIEGNFTQSLNRKIDYSIHYESNEIVIQVLDGETGEVIREISQQDFIQLVDRTSEIKKNVLDEVV